MKSIDSIKKNKPLAIKLSHNNYSKTSIRETSMLNVSAIQLLKHHVQFSLTF